MTALRKPLTRVLRAVDHAHPDHEYAVTLFPGGLIEFRRLGHRTRFQVSLETCYIMAARIAAEQLRKDRADARRLRNVARSCRP